MHGAGYVSNWTISPMAWVILRTGSLDWIKRWAKQGGESIEYWENWDGNWVSSISGVVIDDEWWMIDDGLSMVGLAVMRLWVMAKVKGAWCWWNWNWIHVGISIHAHQRLRSWRRPLPHGARGICMQSCDDCVKPTNPRSPHASRLGRTRWRAWMPISACIQF